MYETELARQLADVSIKLMKLKNIDILSVTDLFCFYNRTRGTALCSPKDCIDAIQGFWPSIGVPVSCKMFGSVLVVQSAEHSDAAVLQKIRELVRTSPTTGLKWAEKSGLPLLIASEQLFQAERAGAICRDESVAGLSFYQNRILEQ